MRKVIPGKNWIAEKGVSVIICCHNSAARLPATLRSIAHQAVPPGLQMEVIIVNNNATDDTAQVAFKEWQQYQLKDIFFTIINEDTPGQMYARIKGATHARFECILFCDDDNHLHPDYIAAGFERLMNNSWMGAVGGNNVPVSDVKFPSWFEEIKDKYGMSADHSPTGDVSERGFILGAGMLTRKQLFLRAFDSSFPSLLPGRSGGVLTTGDDFEFCKRLLLWGYTLYVDPAIHLKHYVPAERLTTTYREKLMQGIIHSKIVLDKYDDAIRIYKKNKNKFKWRLSLVTPFRIVSSALGFSKRKLKDEKLALLYALPFTFTHDRDKRIIKKIMHAKKNI